MPWDVNTAIQHLRTNAKPTSQGQCAQYTRRAVDAGGIRLISTLHAKDYGSSLTKAGFCEVSSKGPFQAGDVAVIQPITGHPDGHMCMFDGSNWISDFKQHSLYPGPAYRNAKPIYKIYRYPKRI